MESNMFAELKPLEAITRLVGAPGFLTDPHSEFAKFLYDNIVKASAANSSVVSEATLQISQAHMGVGLFKQQKDTSRLLAGFVYKTLVPDGMVPKGTRFCKRYRITDQREAQEGTYDTVGNGVQTKEYSQLFQHTAKVVTMQFGCLLSVSVPSVAKDLIARELQRVYTSWELTRTIDILKYCAAQPTLTDRIVQRSKMFSRAERLDAILVMAELLCGTVNLQPNSVLCALGNARRVLGSDRPDVLVMGDTLFRVLSQKGSCNCVSSQIISEDTKLIPEFSVYTMVNENSKGSGAYEFTMQLLTRESVGLDKLRFVDDSRFVDDAVEMKVHYINLGGGPVDKIPIVHVDAVQMEHGSDRDTSTEHKAFANIGGFKWEYVTVGCTPPALGQLDPCHVLSRGESEITYKQLANRSPRVSYLHQYDGSVVPVTLREVHSTGNTKDLFTSARRMQLQTDVNALLRGNPAAISFEQMVSLANTREWYSKIKNPACVLEFDAREMVVPVMNRNGHAADLTPEKWVVRPRVALYNSSSMNSIENEIAQIGSELLAQFEDCDSVDNLQDAMLFLEQGLYHTQGLDTMVAMRDNILQDHEIDEFQSDDWVQHRAYWYWLTDPICAVAVRKKLAAKEDRKMIHEKERRVLLELEKLIHNLVKVFLRVVGERRNSVLASLPACFNWTPYQGVGADPTTPRGYPTTFTLEEVDYCNLMYWVVLPILGARVYRKENRLAGEATTLHVLDYKEGEYNLTQELQLDNATCITVPRLNGTCAFAKNTPLRWTDVSELFGPTSFTGGSSTQTGFDESSLVTYVWAIRVAKLADIGNLVAKVLMGIHYSTLVTHNVICNHYDVKYYSGMSYLLFRGIRFTGCGVSLMQQKSALYTLGTEIKCKPTAHNTHQVFTVNQYCESCVIPETLDSPGVHIPNLYMKDLRGGEVTIGGEGPFQMVVADAFNGFCPESDSACGFRRPYIFTHGRSERFNGAVLKDPLMRCDAYTCMPTLLTPFSSARRRQGSRTAKRNRGEEESNHRLFREALHVVELERGELDVIQDIFRDTADRVNGEKPVSDVMTSTLGVAFCGTYGIGFTSDKKLLHTEDDKTEALVERLAPRISGTGIFARNPIETTSSLINPIFNRIFESRRRSRVMDY